MKIPHYSLAILFVCLGYLCLGQSKRNTHWFFGFHSGIDFSSGAPVAVTTGKLESIEGCSAISDKLGNLLFYTNGETVWNKNHAIMSNSSGLIGDQSAIQSALIVPSPADSQHYYLFSTNYSAFRYSEIDMSLNGGLGGVISANKNTLISRPATEALTGTYHCNNRDVWIITSKQGTNRVTFNVFLLSPSGLGSARTQTFNIQWPSLSNVEHLGISQDGSKIAFSSLTGDGKIFLFDFNRYSGTLTLKQSFTTSPQELIYSTALSPDNSKLYITSWGLNGQSYLSQFDLSVADPLTTRINLNNVDYSNGSPNGYGFIGRLQLGPDGKIYVSRWHQKHPFTVNAGTYYSLDSLDAITNPNGAGLNCAFAPNYLYLKGMPTMIGLTNCFSDPMTQLPAVNLGNDTTFTCNINLLLDSKVDSVSYLWNDMSTGKTRQVNDSGWHWVEVLKEGCPVRDSIHVGLLAINIGADTVICNSSINLTLDAKIDSATYKWDDGSTGKTRQIDSLGIYWVEVLTKENCIKTDTMIVSTLPMIDLGNDTTICSGDSILLQPPILNASYLWQDGSTTPLFQAFLDGKYKVTVKKDQCEVSDSIIISIQPKLLLSLGNDTGYCFQQPVLLLPDNPANAYLWQDGSTSGSYIANHPGLYWVEGRLNSCVTRDTILLTQKPIPLINLGPDTSFCKESPIILDAGSSNVTFLWEDSSTNQLHAAKTPGLFFVTVTNIEGCVNTDSLILDTFISPTIDLAKDTFFCGDNILILDAGPGFVSYTWQNTFVGRMYTVNTENHYHVIIKDQNNCSAMDTIMVYKRNKPYISLSEKMKVCEPAFYLTPGSFPNYLWQDGSTASNFFVNDYGTLTITVTDSNLCSNTKTISIENDCPPSVYIPNAFTPNYDQLNDSFKPTTRNIATLSFQIYNRWGKLLFETTQIGEGWYDREASADVYFYILSYTGLNGETGTLKGNFTLLK